MAHGDFSDLPRAVFDIRNKTFNIANNSEYDKCQKVLLRWFMNILIKNFW